MRKEDEEEEEKGRKDKDSLTLIRCICLSQVSAPLQNQPANCPVLSGALSCCIQSLQLLSMGRQYAGAYLALLEAMKGRFDSVKSQ